MYSQYQAPLGTFSYTVQPGDALYEIARRYNTTVENIVAVNNIPNPNQISIGQTLMIPASPPEAIIYTVQPGDALYSIAQQFGTNIENILAFNYLPNPDMLYIGQQLVIPTSLRYFY